MKQRILNLFKKKINIPSYHEKRAVLEFYLQKFNCGVLVETGTFLGDTVEYFRTRVEKVYSIELSTELAEKAQKRFADHHNVKIIQGNSGELLGEISNGLKEPALFWLDGHYSSEFFVGEEYIRTAKGDKDTPIENELRTLMQSPVQHIILIDDARLFVGQDDYPTIEGIQELVNKSKYKYQVSVQMDIIIIIPA